MRPQKTCSSSPGEKPFTVRLITSPGLPTTADSAACPAPWATAASALATLSLPRAWAVTSSTGVVILVGNGKLSVKMPYLPAFAVPTWTGFAGLGVLGGVLGRRRGVGGGPRYTSTTEPWSKPEPLTVTVPPSRTRPGFSVIIGSPPPCTIPR